MRICVADDEQRVREGIVRKLKGCHPYAEVYDVGFGRAALDRILIARPDLLFVDIRMPELDGLEILQAVKKAMPRTEAIVLTGYEEFGYARTALQRGALDYMLKPADRELLRQRVSEAYDRLLAQFAEQVRRPIERWGGTAASSPVCRGGRLSLWFDERVGKTVRFREPGEEGGGERESAAPDGFIGAVSAGSEEAYIVTAPSWPDGAVFYRADEFPEAWGIELSRRTDRRFYGNGRPASPRAREATPEARDARRRLLLAAKEGDRERLGRATDDWLGLLEGLTADSVKRECGQLLSLLDDGVLSESAGPSASLPPADRDATLRELGTWPELRAWMRETVAQYLPSPAPAAEAVSAWEEATRLLESGEGLLLTLEEAASRAGVHPVTFSRLFKQRKGVPFVRYMAEKRMNKARELLIGGHDSVAAVAAAVGYADLRYFVRLFKGAFGMTPGEYRERYGSSRRPR